MNASRIKSTCAYINIFKNPVFIYNSIWVYNLRGSVSNKLRTIMRQLRLGRAGRGKGVKVKNSKKFEGGGISKSVNIGS